MNTDIMQRLLIALTSKNLNHFEPNWYKCIYIVCILYEFVNQVFRFYSLFTGTHKIKNYAKFAITRTSEKLNK